MPGDMGGEPVPEEAWSPLQQLPDQQTADQLQPEVAPGPAAGGGSDLTVRHLSLALRLLSICVAAATSVDESW